MMKISINTMYTLDNNNYIKIRIIIKKSTLKLIIIIKLIILYICTIKVSIKIKIRTVSLIIIYLLIKKYYIKIRSILTMIYLYNKISN
jgi:hypothetical protein